MNSDKGHYNYNDEQGQVRVKKKNCNYKKYPEKWHNMTSKSFIRIRIPTKKDTLKNTYVVFYTQKLTHRIIGQNLNGQNLPRAPSLSLSLSL
jgi:hypothetical protein